MLRWINQNLNISPAHSKLQLYTNVEETPSDQLPGTLASRILDLQFLCEGEGINKELVVSLTCLYMEAIQFYQSQNNQKQKIYHKRKEIFLKKTAVIQILQGKSGQLVSKREDAQKLLNQARNKSKSEVVKLLSNIQKKQTRNNQVICKMIESQNKRLEERIHKRKTMSNRSSCSDREEDLNEEGHNKYTLNSQRNLEEISVVLHKINKIKRVFI